MIPDPPVLESVLVAGFLLGIRLMRRPRTAVAGNLLGSLCMLSAVVLTLLRLPGMLNPVELALALAAGGVIGAMVAVRVAMVQMPQLVALLNGFGGAASALVALNTLWLQSSVVDHVHVAQRAGAGLALGVGTLTLLGSLVAAAKLAAWLRSNPLRLPGHGLINTGAGTATLLLAGACAAVAADWLPVICVLLIASAALFGLMMTLRVGGADMPIVISLLNSLSGMAAAIAGFAIGNPLLVATGGIVGAAGLILTQNMCRAMNRSLSVTLSGFVPAGERGNNKDPDADRQPPGLAHASVTAPPSDIGETLQTARNVMLVPGYGMAVAQAQNAVKQLADRLESRGCEVRFAVHPVAGRMPGHMNVLLAEVDVDYEKLLEMDAANAAFAQVDLAIVIGANDVVNPAANTARGTPIYGMPVLNVAGAEHVLICNLDRKPGYAGVDNPLYEDSRVTFIPGDARESVNRLIALLDR